MIDCPSPLTPANCDLREFPFMPLMVSRLRRSKAWLMAKRRPELGFYMINLWTASWHDFPAASLDDDDDVLADLAMCDVKKWASVRDRVLHGWIKCSDGRLYHPVVAEQAISSWSAKQSYRERLSKAREAKARREPQANEQHHTGASQVNGTHVIGSITGSTTEDVTGHKGEREGQGQGQGQGERKEKNPPTPQRGRDDDPEFSAFWAAYPRKDDKGHARKAWAAAVKRAQPPVILAGLTAYRFSPDIQYIPLPATWLNGERWGQQTITTPTPPPGPRKTSPTYGSPY